MKKMIAILLCTGSAWTVQATEGARIQWNGSGCSPKTAPLDPRGEQLHSQRDDLASFIVKKGSKLPLKDSRKNCAGIISVDGLKGEQIAVEKIILSGESKDLKGQDLELSADVSVQGHGGTQALKFPAPEKDTGKFSRELSIAADKLLWTDCKNPRALTLNIKQRIAGAASPEVQEAHLASVEVLVAKRSCDPAKTQP